MKVFHGTSFRRYQKIILKGSIDITTEENTHYSLNSDKTTTKYGGVYLTDNHTAAMEFGLRCWLNDNQRYGYHEDQPEIAVFQLDMDCNELNQDKEESEINNYSTTVGKAAGYYYVKHNIYLSNACKLISLFNFDSQYDCCKYIDKVVFNHSEIAFDCWSFPNGKKSKNFYMPVGLFKVIISSKY